MTKIVTWNVNSIHARLTRLVDFLRREQPDYLCLQELKCTEERYPYDVLTEAGYTSAVYGQKAYNGVAILTKKPVAITAKNFLGLDCEGDEAARFLVVNTGSFHLMNAYVPNGQAVGTDKFAYKMAWLKRARQYLDQHYKTSDKIVLVGDFNIAPDDRDVYDPVAWKDHIHCTPAEREALAHVTSFGLIDVFRMHHQGSGLFSWWDYRELSFAKNKGLRIDLIYGTPTAARHCLDVRVDRDERKGEKPSDHAPVIAEFSDAL